MHFTELEVQAKPSSVVTLRFEATTPSGLLPALAEVFVLGCQRGEETTGLTCRRCSQGFFNLEPGTPCLPCPENAVCAGGDSLIPVPGYWRFNSNSSGIQQYVSWTWWHH